MAFSEERLDAVFNNIVMAGVSGGPQFSTTVVTVNGGFEQRNRNWTASRGQWQLGNRLFKDTELQIIIDFFNARGGKWQGFRFKDWSDFRDMGRGILGTGSAIAKTNVYQMNKKYQSGPDSYIRKIAKPIGSTVKVFKNSVEVVKGSAFGNWSIDQTTGLITFVVKAHGITGISKSSQAVITSANTFQIGDKVYFDSIVGMTELNGLSGNVIAAGASSYTVDVNTSTFSTYVSGGVATKYPFVGGEAVTWTGEFDVPVRFDTDKFECQTDDVTRDMQGNVTGVFSSVGSLPIVEIRI